MRKLTRLLPIVLVVATWELVTATGIIRSDEMPSASSTFSQLAEMLLSGEAFVPVWDTLRGWTIGFAIGSVLAVFVGALIGLSGWAFKASWPLIELVKNVPAITIVPLAIVLFGSSMTMKVSVVVFAVFWPLAIQAMYGVRSLDPVASDTGTALGMRGPSRFFFLTLPSAAPFLATGLRVAAAVALVLCVIAELVGGARGLGHSIMMSVNAGPTQLPATYGYIILTGIVGVMVTSAVQFGERRWMGWHESQRLVKGHTT